MEDKDIKQGNIWCIKPSVEFNNALKCEKNYYALEKSKKMRKHPGTILDTGTISLSMDDLVVERCKSFAATVLLLK